MAKVSGTFNLHGIVKPVTLTMLFNGGYTGMPMDPGSRVGFSGFGTFKRSDFGIAAGIPQPGSKMGVGDEIAVQIEAELKGK